MDRFYTKFTNLRRRLNNRIRKFDWRFKRTISKEELIQDLKQIKLVENSTICVHSSLSRIGKVRGGAHTVVTALMEALDGSTLVFPTYTLPAGSMEDTLNSDFKFNVKESMTTLGAIPTAAQNSAQFLRSIHPTHSFVAAGPLSEELIKDHHFSITPTGKGSPLYKMSFMPNAYLLLLGSPFGSFTSGHCVQDRVSKFPYQPYSDKIYKAKCTKLDGSEVEVATYAHNSIASKYRWDRDEKTRSAFIEEFKKEKISYFFKVGNCTVMLINCVELESVLEKLLTKGLTIFGSIDRIRSDPETEQFLLKGRELFWQQ